MRQLFVHFFVCSIFCSVMPVSALSFGDTIKTTLAGEIKSGITVSDFEHNSIQSEFKESVWYDSGMNLRVKTRTFFNENLDFTCHYLLLSSWGDSAQSSRFFEQKYPGSISSQIFKRKFENDNTSLIDLSSQIKQGQDSLAYHRLDRFNLSIDNNFGRVVLGRQATTWGNGLVFNPMDIFNPFSPYDSDRDYKQGEDLAYFETFFNNGDDLQLLYVPRRDLEDGDIKFSESSIAAKYHLYLDNLELDFMTSKHYEDIVTGLGLVRTVKNAVLRSDVIYTFAGGDMEEDFLSFIINMDYSWIWFKKNFYGLIEYHYSGIGIDNDYSTIFTDYDISTRISRGEIYGLGVNYLNSNLQIEINPLLNFNVLIIANINDPSYLIQPLFTYSILQNLEVKFGANVAVGGRDDEYGQIEIPFSSKTKDFGSNAFIWVTKFF
jgi:hypothetical protein